MTLERDLMAAQRNVRQVHIDRLLDLGLTSPALAKVGYSQLPFGVLRIATDDARWWPDPEGFSAMVVPVLENGREIDIVAFRTHQPARWWWRIGCATFLGADLLHSLWEDGPLRIAATPLEWLREGGEALTILDWDAPYFDLIPLLSRERLICADDLLAARLGKRLADRPQLPSIITRVASHA
ncbi:hypothetical protein [Sphingorhabdus sp.]|uniref:hypothetical protein n=1 Tax=Sphingorhabdus sp. TaxID=1902408 RepID=UPI0039195A30